MIPVVAGVIRRDGKVLIAQRPGHKRHGLMWEFPGGKVRPGESVEEALRRELREELGLIVTAVEQVLGIVHDAGSPFEIRFVEVEVDGTPRAFEHLAVRWVRPKELSRLALAPADRQFASVCLQSERTEPED